MRKVALCLVTLTLGCAGSAPMGPVLPEASFVCDVASSVAGDICPQATGSLSLEVVVVTITPVP